MGSRFTQTEYSRLRHCMVEEQIRARGVCDEVVLAAMENVPRHLCVPEARRLSAYDDAPLPIGSGQTISQPYMVARMTELLRLTRDCRVLEVGTGSGYQAAVLAEIACEVFTVERIPELARQARELLQGLGYANVKVIEGDGTRGYPDAAPYDCIVVTAAAPRVPAELRAQLRVHGRMVIPVAAGDSEDLLLIDRLEADEPRFRETSVLRCVFVPLVGEDGYPG